MTPHTYGRKGLLGIRIIRPAALCDFIQHLYPIKAQGISDRIGRDASTAAYPRTTYVPLTGLYQMSGQETVVCHSEATIWRDLPDNYLTGTLREWREEQGVLPTPVGS